MCAIYGFLDYGKKISHKRLKKLLRELSVAAECRGTDATGISYIKNGNIVIFKKAMPAHKLNLFFPIGTTAVIGHNRFTTQGSEDKNFNNHPFEGKTKKHSFALAHNGVLHNDKELRFENNLPETKIETDSYIAVQLLEQHEIINFETIKSMSEAVSGSFVFTILRDDNTLFLVKGSNPISLFHFKSLGLYIYASTKEILETAMRKANFREKYTEIPVKTCDIIEISSDGKLQISIFEDKQEGWFVNDNWYDLYDDFSDTDSDVELLRLWGYDEEEIASLLLDSDIFQQEVAEIKSILNC